MVCRRVSKRSCEWPWALQQHSLTIDELPPLRQSHTSQELSELPLEKLKPGSRFHGCDDRFVRAAAKRVESETVGNVGFTNIPTRISGRRFVSVRTRSFA